MTTACVVLLVWSAASLLLGLLLAPRIHSSDRRCAAARPAAPSARPAAPNGGFRAGRGAA
ncbi:hypothetical protein [uncultured Streptomyces sp.]|uniref:hypothetical protein n=1 Tax=uncultured Streptomyces sp. TaxID=174707 RepID=UPI0026053560|nr:hypothetical protein [uncultured Streptomyces sp.]